MIAYGVTYPAFAQLAKQVFVEVAEAEFALAFKRQTDSRIALVTGLARKEIAQLRRRRAAAGELPDIEETVVTHVIGRWMAGPPYATPDGTPRRLPYEGTGAQVPSFARLVREIGGDIPVRAVLDELLRIGSAHLAAEGDVELRREAHIPAEGAEGRFTLLGNDPGELFGTIAHNIEHPTPPGCNARFRTITSAPTRCRRCARRRAGRPSPVRRANALVSSLRSRSPPDAPPARNARRDRRLLL